MRYAYVKNGDAVEQARRVLEKAGEPGGVDAFVGDFIHTHASDAVLLLCRAGRRERLVHGSLVAESYPVGRGALAGLNRLWTALRVGIAILRWRPQRIVCGCVAELLWICVLVAKLLRVPIVCSRHSGLLERKGLGRLLSGLDAASIRACDAVVCHGPFLAHQVQQLGVPQSRIHQFDVDLRRFVANVSAPAVDPFPGALVVMYVGRIQANKGVLDLLRAFQACVSAQPQLPACLVYVGTGRDDGPLREAVTSSGLEQRVRLLGSVAHAQLPALMRQATVIAAPTQPELGEGRCMVVLEAMALGVPVVAPDFAAFPYAIRDEVDGLLYPPGSVTALSDRLARVLSDAAVRQRLRRGAELAGQRLLVGRQGFAGAVEAAFLSS
jgi:glycosyltransferase involved in cell wall biosynthesis